MVTINNTPNTYVISGEDKVMTDDKGLIKRVRGRGVHCAYCGCEISGEYACPSIDGPCEPWDDERDTAALCDRLEAVLAERDRYREALELIAELDIYVDPEWAAMDATGIADGVLADTDDGGRMVLKSPDGGVLVIPDLIAELDIYADPEGADMDEDS